MDFVYDEDEYSDQGLEDTTEIDYGIEDFNDDHDQALGNESNSSKPEINYSVLNNDDIKNHLKEDVAKVCNLLAVSRASAICLLLHYNWHVDNTLENWVGEEEKVRTSIGLSKNPTVNYSDSEITNCGICFEDYTRRNMKAASCGHPYCSACWKGYLTTSIADGAGCLTLRCPEPKCGAVVGQDMIDELVSNRDKKKYYDHLIRSYVESSRSRKWCPAPGCDYVVEHTGDDGSGSGNYNSVTCSCMHSFCWSCQEDPHRPVNCDIISKWILKNKDESENVKWIFAYTKPCPQCKKPIQKNQGCATMYCPASCNFRFCWTCLRGLGDHRGGCNAYNTENTDNDTENMKKRAKEALDRYVYYYERWAGNKVSREKAIASLREVQTAHFEKFRKVHGQTDAELEFLTKAWQQIIECRRVLMWTYAYGYYLPEEEQAKKCLFEFLQGQAETELERLHHCAEKELEVYLQANVPVADFKDFRNKLINLTNTTHNYFENQNRALENDLADVDSYDIGDLTKWFCEQCTFLNNKSAKACEICEAKAPAFEFYDPAMFY